MSWAGIAFWATVLGLLMVIVGLVDFAVVTVTEDKENEDEEEAFDDDMDD